MIRRVIKIDEDLCNGCGLCVTACHEGAIGLIDGKAKLLRDDYCDGLGNCLPACPTGAITFEEREAADFDEEAVKKHMEAKAKEAHGEHHHHHGGGCPGSNAKAIQRPAQPPMGGCPGSRAAAISRTPAAAPEAPMPWEGGAGSQLNQWPVQIKLVPVNAPYFSGANLLIAADCTAYAYGNFHNRFMKNHITIIGCPKLDEGDYSEKLTDILRYNDIKSVTVVRMEVPCCGGISHAAITALKNCGKMVPWQVVTISTDGEILED